MDMISVDDNGYVWVGGLKVFRLTNWGVVEFFDRDRRRALRRNSNFVYADTTDLIRIILSSERTGSIEQIQSSSGEEEAKSPEE